MHQHQALAWLERRIVANERGLIAAQNLLPALAFGFLVQVQAHLRSWIVVREFHLVSGSAVRNLDAEELRPQPRRQQRSCRSRPPKTQHSARVDLAYTPVPDPPATFPRGHREETAPPD